MLTDQQKIQLTSIIDNTTPCLVTDALVECIDVLLLDERVKLRYNADGSIKDVIWESNEKTII